MDSKDLIQILKSEPLKFTYDEIEQMMDEELEKDPAEMDTDFIDLCANVLNQAIEANKENESNNKSNNKKHIKIRILKIAAIAAILAITIGIAVPVAAKYVDNDTSDKIVQFYEDHTYDVDIVENNNDLITAVIDFNNQDKNQLIRVIITNHKNGINTILNNDIQVTSEYDSAKQLNINGIDVLIFGSKTNSSILYIDNDTEYDIALNNYNFDSAVEIAESIE